MSDSNNQVSTGAHPTGSNHHPGLVDIPNKEANNLNDADETKDEELVQKTEKEKNQEQTESDFEEFNIDKVDDLEESKKKSNHK